MDVPVAGAPVDVAEVLTVDAPVLFVVDAPVPAPQVLSVQEPHSFVVAHAASVL